MKNIWSLLVLVSAMAAFVCVGCTPPAADSTEETPETSAKPAEAVALSPADEKLEGFAKEILTAGKVNWTSDFSAAMEKAKAEGKMVFVKYTASYCAPCKTMEKEALSDDAVVSKLDELAVAVHVDIDTATGEVMDDYYPKKGVPAGILVDPASGQAVDRYLGYPAENGVKDFSDWLDKNTPA